MKDEDLDITRAGEAWSQYHLARRPNEPVPGMGDVCHSGHATIDVAYIAARLAREGWTPPDPLLDEARQIAIVAYRERYQGADGDAGARALLARQWDKLPLVQAALIALHRGMELAKP